MPTDFVTSVGRVPAALMTELIGVPSDMRERFIEMSPVAQGVAYGAATIAAFFLAPASERFIYFQF